MNSLQTDQEYRQAMTRLEQIFASAIPGTPEGDEFKLLADLIKDWEQRNVVMGTWFVLDAEKWEAFQKALEAPPRPMPRLKALLAEPGFFDADIPQGPQIRLAPEDQEAFAEAILQPPPPPPALVRALERLKAFEAGQRQDDQEA